MGADLLFITQEIKHPKETVLDRVQNLDLSEEDLARFENCGVFFPEPGTAWEELEPQLRARLMEAVEVVYTSDGNRDCGYFYVDGTRKFLITGGTSWGDAPSSVWDDFYLVQEYSAEIME
jgi:hypothetical protein